MQKTYVPKAEELSRDWALVDASGQTLGRLASHVAHLLLGKNKPGFMPGVMMGDFVVVVNCEKIVATGNKLDDKMYYKHSNYPGGMKSINLRDQLQQHPDRVLRAAVWGMVPHNSYGRQLIKRLKIYAGPEHPHAAQNPKPIA